MNTEGGMPSDGKRQFYASGLFSQASGQSLAAGPGARAAANHEPPRTPAVDV